MISILKKILSLAIVGAALALVGGWIYHDQLSNAGIGLLVVVMMLILSAMIWRDSKDEY